MDGLRVFSGVAAFAFKFERSNDLRSRDMPFFCLSKPRSTGGVLTLV